MTMTIAQAKSELMQIYGALSPDKQRAIDTLVKIEPKTGHWIEIYLTDTGDIDGQCSECGFIHKFIDRHTAQYNYCPNCGAKMENE